jgi:hypothetical protein
MDNQPLPYALAIIRLLQGVIYNDDKTAWDCLLLYQRDIRQHFAGIGIDVFIQENEGYAFLKHQEFSQDENIYIPHIIERRQLSYHVTLLSVLLFEKLIEFDMKGADSSRLIIDREEIKETIRLFLPDGTDEVKITGKVDTHISKLEEIGFLRRLSTNPNQFEVRRILKAKISADGLEEIKTKLREHAKLIS